MQKFIPALAVLLLVITAQQVLGQENHRHEAGSGTLLARSAFAHGYRHGYEAGYHEGNVDINMVRLPRIKMSQFGKLPRRYEPDFGSRRLFETGFQAGLKAGYTDGYAGNTFRAVDDLRAVAGSLAVESPPGDSNNVYFDRGVAAGYHDGFKQAVPRPAPRGKRLNFQLVPCAPSPAEKDRDMVKRSSYCQGYRRGFVLGYGDGQYGSPDRRLLEASK